MDRGRGARQEEVLPISVNLRGQGDRLTFSHNFNRVPTRPVARPKKHVGLSRQLFGMYSSSSFSTSISRHLTRYTKIVANSQGDRKGSPLLYTGLPSRSRCIVGAIPCGRP